MPSNNDLITEIKKLDPEVSTEGKNNVELAALLSTLKAAEAAKAEEAKAAEAAKAKAKPEVEVFTGYRVCQGKAITTKTGIAAEGATVEAKDLHGGQEALDRLKQNGYLKQ